MVKKSVDNKLRKLAAAMQAYEAAKSMGLERLCCKLDARICRLMNETHQ